tara:strand:+ start:160 stop:1020 length:861 start_codon:yes stop_codon:yes gene_type:complete
MTGRTDIHRPSVIEPEDYDFVAFEYLKTDDDIGMCHVLMVERQRIKAHRAQTGADYSHHAHGGNCHVCGAHCIYTALFYHRPSNVYIRTGLDCAEKLDCLGAEAFRSKIGNVLEAAAGKRRAEAVLEQEGIGAAWPVYTALVAPTEFEEATIRDIVGKLVRYGDISEKQVSFVGKLLVKIDRRAETTAKREAEHEAAEPVPEGGDRVTVRGKVLSIWTPEYDAFARTKMLVQSPAGWKVCGTLPASLSGASKGDTVQFVAKLAVSRDDPKFGFFSRPTKAEVIAAA